MLINPDQINIITVFTDQVNECISMRFFYKGIECHAQATFNAAAQAGAYNHDCMKLLMAETLKQQIEQNKILHEQHRF